MTSKFEMAAEVVVRPLEAGDLEAIVEIQEEILQRKIAPGWVNLVRLQLSKPEGITLVALEGDEVAGFIFAAVKHGHFGLELAGWVETCGVRPRSMGRGVGRVLAKAAFDRFREYGVREVYSAVRWDSGDLNAFFKELGFGLSDMVSLELRLD